MSDGSGEVLINQWVKKGQKSSDVVYGRPLKQYHPLCFRANSLALKSIAPDLFVHKRQLLYGSLA